MINMCKIKAYVSLPIIKAKSLHFNKKYVNLLKSLGIIVRSSWVAEFPNNSLTPHEVFKRDINAIMESDVLIADVTEPSHGVGAEIMYAYLNKKPIIMTHREGTSISYMIRGMPSVRIIAYKNLEDLKSKLVSVLEEIRVRSSPASS